MKVHPYLNYGGNCEEAFRFYEKHLGAKLDSMMRFSDAPGSPIADPAWQSKILYAHLTIGSTELSGNDVEPERFEPMRSAYLSLNLESNEDAERIFGIFSDGGDIFMPMAETFFAHRFAMLRDRFGTSWMIIHQKPMQA
ncbi:MAG TPA: VOC family protein [Acidobacteriaceae bacterium]|nr:VOC family protein [Acidobacteriaceae bacterium]